MLTILKGANLALAFFMELAVLVALGYWGFQTNWGIIARIGLGIGLPILAIVVWALFGAPTASWHLEGFWRLVLLVVFFGSAVVALFLSGQQTLGVLFCVVFVLNQVLIRVWPQ